MNSMFTWKAYEHKNFTKTNDWFWAIGLISLIGAGLAIYSGSFSFGVFILLAGFSLILFGNVKHPEHSILITEEALMVDQNKFLWKDVVGFAIIDDPRNPFEKKVIFETNRPVNPVISLPVDRQTINPGALKDFLLAHSTEKELRESVSKAISEAIKF